MPMIGTVVGVEDEVAAPRVIMIGMVADARGKVAVRAVTRGTNGMLAAAPGARQLDMTWKTAAVNSAVPLFITENRS